VKYWRERPFLIYNKLQLRQLGNTLHLFFSFFPNNRLYIQYLILQTIRRQHNQKYQVHWKSITCASAYEDVQRAFGSVGTEQFTPAQLSEFEPSDQDNDGFSKKKSNKYSPDERDSSSDSSDSSSDSRKKNTKQRRTRTVPIEIASDQSPSLPAATTVGIVETPENNIPTAPVPAASPSQAETQTPVTNITQDTVSTENTAELESTQ
jgi:hypothetical protein